MKKCIKLICISVAVLLCALPVHANGDTNEDGRISLADLTCLINWLLNPNTSNNHAYVDLGLPSGTLWATQNIGADGQYDSGAYIAWGETQDKDTYTWQNYQWATADTTLTRYGKNSALWSSDDAANVLWGGLWRVPTLEQWKELLSYCRWSWALVNGQYGYRISANGTGIFLPAAGYFRNDIHYEDNISGFYWARGTSASDSLMAYGLYLDDSDYLWGYRYRYTGRNIRPVLQPSDLLRRFDVNGDDCVTQADVTALIQILLER